LRDWDLLGFSVCAYFAPGFQKVEGAIVDTLEAGLVEAEGGQCPGFVAEGLEGEGGAGCGVADSNSFAYFGF